MRSLLIAIVSTVAALASAMAETPDEVVTAPNAILCVSPGNLDIANQPAVGESQLVLRAMGCLRTESGIRTRLLEPPDLNHPWRVRFYPAGISGGVVLWGLPSSFTTPDRLKLIPARRAGS